MSDTLTLPASVFASRGAEVEHLYLRGWPARAIDRLRREARRMREDLRRARDRSQLDRMEHIRRHRERLAVQARHTSALRRSLLARPLV